MMENDVLTDVDHVTVLYTDSQMTYDNNPKWGYREETAVTLQKELSGISLVMTSFEYNLKRISSLLASKT